MVGLVPFDSHPQETVLATQSGSVGELRPAPHPSAREDSSGLWRGAGTIRLEQDVFSALAGQGQIYVHLNDGIWSQIKSAGYGRGPW